MSSDNEHVNLAVWTCWPTGRSATSPPTRCTEHRRQPGRGDANGPRATGRPGDHDGRDDASRPDVTLDELGPTTAPCWSCPAPTPGQAVAPVSRTRPASSSRPARRWPRSAAPRGTGRRGAARRPPPHQQRAEFLAAIGYAGSEHYVDEPSVTDGDLVTASRRHPVEFARAVFAPLDLYDPASWPPGTSCTATHDPAGYFELTAAA